MVIREASLIRCFTCCTDTATGATGGSPRSRLSKYADRYDFIIVCPDGNYSNWYMDSPVDSSFRYETYMARELLQWVDEHYKTIRSREGRAITGLSMGGHGAFYLAFRNQDTFGAAGSMSGGVDIKEK